MNASDAGYFPQSAVGCTDGNCLFQHNTGLATNGGCQCEKTLNRTPEGRAAVKTIRWLRQQLLRKQLYIEENVA